MPVLCPQDKPDKPVIRPLRSPLLDLDPVQALLALQGMPGLCFLDSARQDDPRSRYSFLMADPFEVMEVSRVIASGKQGTDPEEVWVTIRDGLRRYRMEPEAEGPPFRGGAAGYFSYELARTLEDLPEARPDRLDMPLMRLPLYDVVIAFDHLQGQAWLYSSGFPESDEEARVARALARRDRFLALLRLPVQVKKGYSPQPAMAWQSNFTAASYRGAVERVRQYIAAGDIFQANISQRFSTMLQGDFDPISFYLRLRSVNAAPFAAFMDWGGGWIASSSPERFVRLYQGEVETRPIKGTRPRLKDPQDDALQAEGLLASPKDRAENTMIVDLLRNDFSRVCRPGSVHVPVLCGLETFAGVHHLVSEVRGSLEDGMDPVDLLQACFPGGSVTGAPKKRSMEIIHELEPVPRHVYCGAIGYLGFDGNMDTSIPIRTVILTPHQACFQAGGGITWLSDPGEEYQETLDKAAHIFSAFGV